jgi:Glycine zipper 2TM domain
MRKFVLAATLASALAVPAFARPPAHAPAHGWRAQQAYDAGYRDAYRANRYDDRRAYGSRYYDGRCRKDSNSEGTVIGAVGGGVLGNVLAKRGDRTLGTVVGAGLGGLIGREIDKSEKRCR